MPTEPTEPSAPTTRERLAGPVTVPALPSKTESRPRRARGAPEARPFEVSPVGRTEPSRVGARYAPARANGGGRGTRTAVGQGPPCPPPLASSRRDPARGP